MPDTYTTLRNVIEPYLAEHWAATAVQWPNTGFQPPVGAAWIQPVILPGRATPASLGGGGTNATPGLLHVNVFVLRETGTAELWSLVDALRNLFNRKTVGPVRFSAPYPTPFMIHESWVQAPVLCPFSAHEDVE